MDTSHETGDTLKSVEHAIDVLEIFGASVNLYTLSEIAQQTGLSKSSVYRLVRVLVRRGYLEKNATTGKYRLGYKVLELARYRLDDLELVAEAHPLMLRLHTETSLTTQLCVLDGTEVIYLDEVSAMTARRHANMGYRGKAYCSSMGKCLLAALSGEELDERFFDYRFTRYTETTITSYDQLKAELREVRRQGYALNRGEENSTLSSIACPIYDYNGSVVAAISLGAATFLLIPETIEVILPHLRRYARMISIRMGYPEEED